MLMEHEREKGPVELLCKEIDFRFEKAMERTEILVAFVEQLVSNIERHRHVQAAIASLTGEAASEASGLVLARAVVMLRATKPSDLIQKAAAVHDIAQELNPEDAYPTDHIIDMLSSCASAIRFGLETPCHSRHAADAAQHVWRQRYGISLHDELSSAWCKDWTRTQLQRASLRLATYPSADRDE